MKHFTLLLIFSLFTSSLFAQMEPRDFNELLISEQNSVNSKNREYMSYSVHSEDFATIESKRKEVVKQIEKSLKKITETEAPEEAVKLKEEGLEVFKLYKDVFTLDFAEVNELKQNQQSSFEAMEQYFEAQDAAEKKLSKATENFAKAQERFAKKLGVELKSSEEAKQRALEAQEVNKVYEYRRNIFLLEFKVSKADAAFMDALNEKKSASYLDTKRNKLSQIADDALDVLKSDKGFKGDKAYRDSALDLIKFYKTMANENYEDMVELVRMQAKNSDRFDNDDIKKYNELVERFNATIVMYNENIRKLTTAYNQEESKLLQKHVPNIGVPKGKVQRM